MLLTRIMRPFLTGVVALVALSGGPSLAASLPTGETKLGPSLIEPAYDYMTS